MGAKLKILSTAPLDDHILLDAISKGVAIDVVSMIQTIDVSDEPFVQQEIEWAMADVKHVVFTSSKAVYAVCESPFFKRPDWKICCTAPATRKVVLQYFPAENIVAAAESAMELASVMAEKGVTERVVFFCGDLRMDTLPRLLKARGTEVKEVVVYKTVELPSFIATEYDAILFFSPSAVSSYFGLNIPDPGTVLFAVGNTTANAIRENSNNVVVVSSEPAKNTVVADMMSYFNIKKNA